MSLRAARSALSPFAMLLTLWLTVGLVFSSSGCSRRPSDGSEPSDAVAAESTEEESAAVPVEITVIERGPIESVIEASATLEAERQVTVHAEAARGVQALQVEEGDRVRKGELLLRLQDDEQQSGLAKAQTLLDQAQRESDRQERLWQQQLTTEKARNDALAELEQRKLDLVDAKRELGYTLVKAPIDGTVTQRLVKVGDQVQLGQSLFEIIDFNSLVARIFVPEKDLPRMRVGARARLTAPALSSKPFEASVLRIAPVVDARTGTVKVTVEVGGQPGLRPGLYVDVSVITDIRHDAILLPKRALIYDHDETYVYRVGEERRVERLRVISQLADSDFVVPTDGIAAGDSIVTAGQAGLKDGSRVTIMLREESGEDSRTSS